MTEQKIQLSMIYNKISEGFKSACSAFGMAIHDSAFRDIENDETKQKPVCRFIFELDKSSDLKPKKIKEQSQAILKTISDSSEELVSRLSNSIQKLL